MQHRLDDLRISHPELEELTGLDISDTFIGHGVRLSAIREPGKLAAFILTEFIALLLILVFCLPASLVIGRNIPGFSGSASSIGPFLSVSLSISLVLFALWNAYIFFKGYRLQTLNNLLEDVDRHNEIIDAVYVMQELDAAQQTQGYPPQGSSVQNRDELRRALEATRSSLRSALVTEKILRKHQRFVNRRYELFADIETNLVTLQTINRSPEAIHYRDLLDNALLIGLSVRQEIEQLKDK